MGLVAHTNRINASLNLQNRMKNRLAAKTGPNTLLPKLPGQNNGKYNLAFLLTVVYHFKEEGT